MLALCCPTSSATVEVSAVTLPISCCTCGTSAGGDNCAEADDGATSVVAARVIAARGRGRKNSANVVRNERRVWRRIVAACGSDMQLNLVRHWVYGGECVLFVF